MSARLTSRMLIGALSRRVQAAGGAATVLAKGDEVAGAVLLICLEKGVFQQLLERMPLLDGGLQWQTVGPQGAENQAEAESYLARRRRSDPDLWLIELDIASAERFAAETTGGG